MGLFGFDPVKTGGWGSRYDRGRDCRDGEKGYDMSSVRGKQAEIAAQEEADEAVFTEERKPPLSPRFEQAGALLLHAPQYGKRFFRDVAGKAPLFGKDKCEEKFANAPLIHGMMAHVNSDSWLPVQRSTFPLFCVRPGQRPYL